MAMNNAAFSFRLSGTLKNEAFKVIEQYGFTPSQLFNLFLTEIANTKTIPLNLSYLKPNADTVEAINEIKTGVAERYRIEAETNIEQLMQDISEERNGESGTKKNDNR